MRMRNTYPSYEGRGEVCHNINYDTLTLMLHFKMYSHEVFCVEYSTVLLLAPLILSLEV